MKLHGISLIRVDSMVRLVGYIENDSGKRIETYFAFPEKYEDFISVSANPFTVAMLVPAMVAGERLTIVPKVSQRLLLGLHRVRDMMQIWFPEYHRIEIDAVAQEPESLPRSNRAATFFSGGVDSFYTLLKYRRQQSLPAPMTHVIFMRGIETRLDRINGVDESQRVVDQVARAEGVECIIGETDIRSTWRLHWEMRYVGSGLAATALALAAGLDYVCVPSNYSYRDLVTGHGSSPLIEERLSTERLSILFDGAEMSRAEKTGCIIDWNRELVLKHLRVCMMNSGGAYNCGECYKCVRTAVALAIAGVPPDMAIFQNRSTSHWERCMRMDRPQLVRENQEYAHKMGAPVKLVAMLDRVMRSSRRRAAARALIEDTPLDKLAPAIGRLRERFR